MLSVGWICLNRIMTHVCVFWWLFWYYMYHCFTYTIIYVYIYMFLFLGMIMGKWTTYPSWLKESILKNIGFPMTVDGSGNSVSREVVMKEFDSRCCRILFFVSQDGWWLPIGHGWLLVTGCVGARLVSFRVFLTRFYLCGRGYGQAVIWFAAMLIFGEWHIQEPSYPTIHHYLTCLR